MNTIQIRRKTVTYLGIPVDTFHASHGRKATDERVSGFLYATDHAGHGRKAGDLVLKHHTGDGTKPSTYTLHDERVIEGGAEEDVQTYVAERLGQ